MKTLTNRIKETPERRARAARLNRQQTAEDKLTGTVIGRLAAAIAAARVHTGRGPAPRWHQACEILPHEWIALAVLSAFLRPWIEQEDSEDSATTKAPAVATVVKRIGQTIAAPVNDTATRLQEFGRSPFKPINDIKAIGNDLLSIAVQADIVEIRSEQRVKLRQDALRVYPSESTRAELETIHAKLATIPELYPQPLDRQPRPEIVIRPNKTGAIEPEPPGGESVAEALELMQRTQWRVNLWAFNAFLSYYNSTDASAIPHDVIATLGLAGEWSTRERFYYQHTFDWRGRTYQRGGALHWTGGSDLARGLLEFARGEPLDERGQRYLGMYLTDLVGIKNRMLQFRWLDENAGLIERCATRPVEVLREWHTDKGPTNGPAGNKPFTFLAACRAWFDGASGKPIHVPIFLDCTCSGLQHYAYLMRDVELGRKLGLSHFGGSDDFYTIVANAIGESRAKVKPGTMQTFYGASAETIGGALGERPPYALAQRIRAEAWRTAGEPTKALYDWLRAVERAFTRRGEVIERTRKGRPRAWADSAPIRWTAPSGFRVIHDERIQKAYTLEIPLPGRTPSGKRRKRNYTERRSLETFDANAQHRGIAPNFIHSMDAALLIETVRQGPRLGIHDWTLAHDAFGTHPNQGHLLFAAPQRAAIEIYSQDVLGGIAAEFERQGIDGLPPVPVHPAELPADFSNSPVGGV